MAMKKYNPITPSLRFTTVVDRSDLSKKEPEKSLTVGKLRSGGRNSNGQISSRFRGGGAKKSYRIIDFKRDKPGSPRRLPASKTIRTVLPGFRGFC